MSATIAPPTREIVQTITHDDTHYTLKLKINLNKTRESTAKLVGANKTLNLGSQQIIWKGIESTPSKKIHKLFKSKTSPIHLKATGNPQDPFEIVISFKNSNQTPSSNTLKSILSIQNSQEFVELFKVQSDSLLPMLHEMANCFCQTTQEDTLDGKELVALLGFLSPHDQKKVANRIQESHSFELIAMAIRSLKNNADYERLLLEAVTSRLSLLESHLIPVLQLFEDLDARGQYYLETNLHLVKHLCQLCHVCDTAEDMEKILEAFNCLKRGIYKSHLPVYSDSLVKDRPIGLSLDELENLVKSQTNKLEFHLAFKSSVFTQFVSFISIYTLQEILAYFGQIEVVRKLKLRAPYAELFLDLKRSNKDTFRLIFLAERAYQTFWAERELHTSQLWEQLAANKNVSLLSLDRPWMFLKPIKVTINDAMCKKLLAAIYLNLLEKAYLRGDPLNLNDFKAFADDFINRETPIENETFLSVHHNWLFVLGLIELLQNLLSKHDNPEIRDRCLKLLKFIQYNNTSENLGSLSLFKIRGKCKFFSSIQKYLSNKIADIVKNHDEKISVNNPDTHTLGGFSRIFQKTIQQDFPWIASLRHQFERLKNDPQLVENRPYLINLNGLDCKKERKNHLKILLDKALSSEHKSILILGDQGTGKTLFFKSYLQDRLENFKIGNPLPFYISLKSIKKPHNALMHECLERFGLANQEQELKKLSTIWFLDDCEEIYQNEREPLNIYRSNRLVEWRNARFVFACQSLEFKAGEIRDYFGPEGESVRELNIVPFKEDEVERFLENYIQARQMKGLPVWSLEDYKKGIKKLGLNRIPNTPQFFRQVIDCLPTLKAEIKIEAACYSLFEAWINSVIRSDPKHNSKPSTHLFYLLQVNQLMEICKKRFISEDPEVEPKKDQGEAKSPVLWEIEIEADLRSLLFNEKHKDRRIEGFFRLNAQGAKGYTDPLLFDFLKEIAENESRKESLAQLLDS